LTGAEDMGLAGVFIEAPGAHAFGEGALALSFGTGCGRGG
jgi:hypothetical protein